ncbi:hypothetical protein ACX6VP_004555 [Yersinia enterocolitica]
MTSREQFEAWAPNYCWKYSTTKELAWLAWQASREAVAVDLPDKQFISEEDVLIPDEVDWPDGFNTALEQCAEAIRAAGIKVKEE